MTNSEQAYIEFFEDSTTRGAEVFAELYNLMITYEPGSSEWRLDMATQLTTVQEMYDEILATDYPDSVSDFHREYVQAWEHFDSAAHLISLGLNEPEGELIGQAIDELKAGSELMDEANEMLQAFLEIHET